MPPADPPPTEGTLPLLIYAPGFTRSATNSGVRVAELVARGADLMRGSYRAVESTSQAGAGLRVCRTIVGPDGRPVLEVVELDYHARLEDADLVGTSRQVPGFVGSGLLAVRGLVMLLLAAPRAGKSHRARFQLLWGFGSLVILLVAAVVAAFAALGAMGVLDVDVTDTTATRVALGTGLTVSAIWAAVRSTFAVGAQRIERVMDFADRPRYRAAVVRTVWEALDGLRDRQWSGPIHLVGFSFGSMVLLDALFPQAHQGHAPQDDAELRDLASRVSSLTTIGCPADFARFYWPSWFADRRALAPELPWVNVLNASDVFGSNFREHEDGTTAQPPDAQEPHPAGARGEVSTMVPGRQIVYLPKKPWWQVLLMADFTVHGEYWGGVASDSCFGIGVLLRLWLFGDRPVEAERADPAERGR